MDTRRALAKICLDFKNEKYEIEEFQSRLETLLITDDLVTVLGSVRSDAALSLERIRFTMPKTDHYTYGVEVADRVLRLISQIES